MLKFINERLVANDLKTNIIYGFNNSGKTSFLKHLINEMCNENIRKVFSKEEIDQAFFMSTNRVLYDKSIMYGNSSVLSINRNSVSYQHWINKSSEIEENSNAIYIIRNKVLSDTDKLKFIENALTELFDEKIKIFEKIKIEFEKSNEQKKFTIQYKQQSDGVDNVINILSICLWLVGENFYKLNKSKFSLLIDEFELYLHINVQIKLLSFLNDTFKKAKFIITTHSPILLQRAANVKIFNIYKTKSSFRLTNIDTNIYFKSLDSINELFFNVVPYPKEFSKILDILLNNKIGLNDNQKNEIKSIREDILLTYPNFSTKMELILIHALEKINDKDN